MTATIKTPTINFLSIVGDANIDIPNGEFPKDQILSFIEHSYEQIEDFLLETNNKYDIEECREELRRIEEVRRTVRDLPKNTTFIMRDLDE